MTTSTLLAMPLASHLPLPEKVIFTIFCELHEGKCRDDLLGDLPALVPFLTDKLRRYDPAIDAITGLVREGVPCVCPGTPHPEHVAIDLEVTFPFSLMPGATTRKLLMYVLALQQA